MSNTGTTQSGTGSSGTSSSFNAPELLGGSVITLSIPATGSVETVTYMVTLTGNPTGIPALANASLGNFIINGYLFGGNNMSNLGIGVSTNASYTSGGAINSSPFAASGTIHGGNWSGNTASANGSSSGAFLYQNKVQATTCLLYTSPSPRD